MRIYFWNIRPSGDPSVAIDGELLELETSELTMIPVLHLSITKMLSGY
jgi:hypothetical protein